MSLWHADLAWVGQVAKQVLIEVEGGIIQQVTPDVDIPEQAVRLHGFTMPGLANVHSHAFHRALRGRTQSGSGDFWTWREGMYAVAAELNPDTYYALARATYAEMALAGITAVGEFHYLHHDPTGVPYADPNAMAEALIAAAREAGIRLTLLDTCYLQGGLDGRPLEGTQRRFGDGDVERWTARVDGLRSAPDVLIGAAIHSVRAVDPASMAMVSDWSRMREAPLHLHLSEQPAENQDCLATTGRTPTELVAEAGVLGPRTTAVHATHLTTSDIERLGGTGTSICLCPTTERDLADGVGPALALEAAGCPLCVGSDSHAMIDIFEEARAIELDQRLFMGRRGIHQPQTLLRAATEWGMQSLSWNAGRLQPGYLADFVAVSIDSPRLAGTTTANAVESVVFAATAADVRDVIVGGRQIVSDRVHTLVPEVGAALRQAILPYSE